MSSAFDFDPDQSLSIVGYGSVPSLQRAAADRAIERIFFAASSVQSFRDDAQRDAFRWLWLRRYLAQEPGNAFVGLSGVTVCGYLVGSLADPAPRAEFSELTYFQDFAAQTVRFPAHLHINVDESARGHGVGALLVDRFSAHAAAMGVSGVHIVTGAGMRNVGFYERLGFREVARALRNGSAVVMLAKALDADGTAEA